MGLNWECPAEDKCSTWAVSYFFDCVCSHSDMISFSLGLTSIICWALAEIRQIVTNWQISNAETVSMAFIFTWMIGDLLNVAGCWINPGTIPTQFYLAVLYTATTVLLVVQQLSYALKMYRLRGKSPAPLLGQGRLNNKSPRWADKLEGVFSSNAAPPKPPAKTSGSDIPATGSSGKPPLPVTASVPVQGNTLIPGSYKSWRHLALSNSYGTDGSSPLARGIIFSSLAVLALTFSSSSSSFTTGGVPFVGSSRRQLIQVSLNSEGKDVAKSVGLILGWLMMCVYLTGRLPQIILNWSNDFVLGVPTSTVIFAFMGNAAYLGSILVRSIEWDRLKLVLPWVVDVALSMCMDLFMISQYSLQHRREGYGMLE